MLELQPPHAARRIALHACCAPCTTAIAECLLHNGIRPTIFFFNPNIHPEQEYRLRKRECKHYAERLGLDFVDADYDHQAWRAAIAGLEEQPERRARCLRCFEVRLLGTAQFAAKQGLGVFATTLAASRWKRIEQVQQAGLLAQQQVAGTTFWAQNWRTGGLQARREQLIEELGIYNQNYCGCEFSQHPQPNPDKADKQGRPTSEWHQSKTD